MSGISDGTPAAERATAASTSRTLWQALGRGVRRQPVWLLVVACLVFFGLSSPYFLTVNNLANVLVQSSFIGFLAVGMTFIIINGNIDLTVGATLGLSAALAIGVQEAGGGPWLGVAAGLLAGLGLGAFNGVVVVFTGVDSFIVTLGGLIGIRGLIFIYTKEQSLITLNSGYTGFGSAMIGPVPVIGVVFLAVVAIGQWVLRRTVHGRNTYAVGGNRDAAVNAGIEVGRHMIANFVLMGGLAGLAGIMLSTQMGAATPNLGTNYELWTIISVVLGGTKLTGGYGSLLGTLGGVIVIGMLRNGMNLLRVAPFYVYVVLGLVLIISLFIDKQVNRR